jgi:hypothetical protein
MPRLARPLAFAALFFLAAGAHAQGVLAFEHLEHDFGSVHEGQKPTYTFVFSNVGDQPVRLVHVRPSCGCTAPSYSTDQVMPGQQGEVVVEYNSEGRPGEFNKTIAVEAEGAEPAHVTLRIMGTVIPAAVDNGVVQGNVSFDADMHEYASLKADEPAHHVFRMQNVGERPLRIQAARSFPEGAEVTYPDRPVFPDEVVEVTVHVPSAGAVAGPNGEMDVAVVLTTDDAVQPAKSLRLRGHVGAAETTETASSGVNE